MKSHGTYHLNPAKKKTRRKKSARRNATKRRGRRMKNPAPYGILLVNPAKRGKSRNAVRKRRRRRNAARRTPSPVSTSPKQVSSSNMKTRRRGRRRHRNASRRRSRRRFTSVAVRNPSRRRHRRSSRRMRNPVSGVVGDIFNSETLTLGAGIVVAQTGTTLVINKLRASQMAQNGSLPGLNPTAPSAIGIMLWKLGLGAGVGYLLRNQSPRFARGLIIGAVAGAMSDLVMQSGVLRAIPGAGVSRNFAASPRVNGFLPGTSTRFTGPASQFLAPGRNGVGRGLRAAVGPGLVTGLPGMINPAFGN